MEAGVDRVLRRRFERLLPPDLIVELARVCEVSSSAVWRRAPVARARDSAALLFVEGWAARWRTFPDGSRQIVAFLLPGDFDGLGGVGPVGPEHGVTALTDCVVAHVDLDRLALLSGGRPAVASAFRRLASVDLSIARTWIANVGRRSALPRIAHLLCELHERTDLVDWGEGRPPALPLTQEDMADATGFTPVHVNRMIARLRSDGLVETRMGAIRVVDVSGLRRLAGFDPAYLHVAAVSGVGE